ncbi:transposase, partial [Sphaerisporangium sp. NPDC051017]|uniref:RNA-guided endonuclease InsQ/TnpB family protein n=1 Tax=Sphaerisporangium sp. NPDC051017 TaxID=3154636 RepID=UPI0034201748
EAKKTPDRSWLGAVSAVVLQQALADLNTAYRSFFDSISGKRKGPKVGPPRFRSRKDNRQAIRFTRNARFSITTGGRLRLPKIGDVDVRWSRSLPADPSSVTVVKDAAGRYLAVKGLARTRLAKSVHDAGWSAFVTMLEYKAALYGRVFHRIDRWFPSSKLCSDCGAVAESMPLNVRSWSCPCGAVHDRDVNAARNILAAGRRQVAAGRKPAPEMGGKRRPKTPVETRKTPAPAPRRGKKGTVEEAGSHRSAAA